MALDKHQVQQIFQQNPRVITIREWYSGWTPALKPGHPYLIDGYAIEYDRYGDIHLHRYCTAFADGNGPAWSGIDARGNTILTDGMDTQV